MNIQRKRGKSIKKKSLKTDIFIIRAVIAVIKGTQSCSLLPKIKYDKRTTKK